MADVKRTMKLQIKAGEASPAPPIGPALGQVGINIGEFVNQFNEATAEMGDDLVPVVIRDISLATDDLALAISQQSATLFAHYMLCFAAGHILPHAV